jgi:hypothetical protein
MMMNRRISPLLLLGLATLGAACKKTKPATEIVLEIGTNIPVPSQMDTLSVTISSSNVDGAVLDQTYSLGTDPNQVNLPKRMTLAPSGTGATVTIQVDGWLATTRIVSRTVITSFWQDHSLFLRIDLLQECEWVMDCPPGQTCVSAGVCTDANIAPSSLPPFDPTQSPQPAPPSSDASAPLDGASDGPSADSPVDVPSAPMDAALDRRVDRPRDGLEPIDSQIASDGPLPSDGPVSRKPNGAACLLKAGCQSGLCVDGICCNSDCSGSCVSCKVPGQEGTCSPVPLNSPSQGDCPDDGAQTCGRNGTCDGAGGCMLYPGGTACSAETCPAGSATHTRPGLCDGHGVCAAGQILDCTPYLCDTANNSCYTGCTTGGAECTLSGQCTNGSCGKKSDGQNCAAPSECTSNFCEQGVCCGSACQDLCTSCAVDGSLGICSPVKSGKPDPKSRCLDKGVTTCKDNGWCDGSGACQKYAAGLSCQPGTCDPTGTTFSAFICNGLGVCGASKPQACAPYHCDVSGCKTSCSLPTDCAPGYSCSASGTCVASTVEDCMNGIDDDGNGLVDCADPACISAGYTCAPTVPSGFTGPGEVYDGPGASPTCDSLYPKDFLVGYATPQCNVSCSDCTCGDPTGVICTNPVLLTGTLLTKCAASLAPRISTCNTVDPSVTVFGTSAGAASGGSCAAGGGTASLSPITSNTGHLCAASAKGGLGCPSGSVCWPKPQQPFMPQTCVFASGDLSCPTTGYPVKRTYYDSPKTNDTRACASTCDCDTPLGAACDAKVNLYSSASTGTIKLCSGLVASYRVPTVCETLPAGVAAIALTASTPSGGSCTPTGVATPAGTCTPTGNPTTACCTQ